MTKVKIESSDADFITVSGTAPILTVDTSARFNGYRNNATDLNADQIKYTRYFPKSGVYKIKYLYLKSLDGALTDIAIDSAGGNNIFDNINQQGGSTTYNNELYTTKAIARGYHDISILAAEGGTNDFQFHFQSLEFELINEYPILGEAGTPNNHGIDEDLTVNLSDESTAITTGAGKYSYIIRNDFVVKEIYAELTTASSSGNPAININDDTVSIFSTTITIDANETDSRNAATPAVLTALGRFLAKNSVISFDIDTAGTGAKGLKIHIIGHAR